MTTLRTATDKTAPDKGRVQRRFRIHAALDEVIVRTSLTESDLPRLPRLSFHCTRRSELWHIEKHGFFGHASKMPDPAKPCTVNEFLSSLGLGADSVSSSLQFAFRFALKAYNAGGHTSFGPAGELPVMLANAYHHNSRGLFSAHKLESLHIVSLSDRDYAAIAKHAAAAFEASSGVEYAREITLLHYVTERFFQRIVRLLESLLPKGAKSVPQGPGTTGPPIPTSP